MGWDYAVMIIYFAAMIGVGYWGMRRAKSPDDFLVAGRRLGVPMYTGTLSAVVLGGASTIGTVRLGYLYGISGMWLVFMLGAGILLLGIGFSHLLARLRVYSVAEMMEKRFNASSRLISGVIMVGYDMMVAVTATIAIGTVFNVMFGLSQTWAIIIGGGVVILYSALGGMWSITLTDIVQFAIMTIGMFAIFLPMAISKAGGWTEMWSKLPDSFSSFAAIGGDTIWLYFLLFFFGIMIGQDIWQRVFTAKSVKVARIGGMTAGLYCIAYGFCGALIGTALLVVLPKLDVPDNVFAEGAKAVLPSGIAGLVLAAALAAVMSTASACLMASSTILAQDVIDRFVRRSSDQRETIWLNRILLVVCGVGVLVISLAIKDVIGALTVAYDLLVGAVFVPVVGALFWRRATAPAALSAMLIGAVVTVVMMAWRGLYSNEAIYWSLVASFVAFVVVSVATPKPSPEKLAEWRAVTSGESQIPTGSAPPEGAAPAENAV
jgi:SSS family solute:Na+ symporter